jgi:hypothetical protein
VASLFGLANKIHPAYPQNISFYHQTSKLKRCNPQGSASTHQNISTQHTSKTTYPEDRINILSLQNANLSSWVKTL